MIDSKHPSVFPSASPHQPKFQAFCRDIPFEDLQDRFNLRVDHAGIARILVVWFQRYSEDRRLSALVNAIDLTRLRRAHPDMQAVYSDGVSPPNFIAFKRSTECFTCQGSGCIRFVDLTGPYEIECLVCLGTGRIQEHFGRIDSDIRASDGDANPVPLTEAVRQAVVREFETPQWRGDTSLLLKIEQARYLVDAYVRWSEAASEPLARTEPVLA